jgi:hypothetical protein
MSKEYRIETVNDFLKLPVDKIDTCLSELATALERTIEMKAEAEELASLFGGLVFITEITMPSFTWIDDGKTDQTYKTTVSVTAKAGK